MGWTTACGVDERRRPRARPPRRRRARWSCWRVAGPSSSSAATAAAPAPAASTAAIAMGSTVRSIPPWALADAAGCACGAVSHAAIPASSAMKRTVRMVDVLIMIVLFHQAEPEMVRAGADVALAARADHVARAVLIGAQERSAAMDALRHAGLARDRTKSAGPFGLRATRPPRPVARSSPGDTSRSPTPRRSRPRHGARSRSAETVRPARRP